MATWFAIHKLVEIVIDFSDGGTVLRTLSNLNWQWRTVFLQWPDPELWRRILHAVHRPSGLQWKLVERFVPKIVEKRSPHTFRDLYPSEDDQGRSAQVIFVTPDFRVLGWLSAVPLTVRVSALIHRAARQFNFNDDPSQRVVFCGHQIQRAETTLAKLRISGSRAVRADVLLVLPDARTRSSALDEEVDEPTVFAPVGTPRHNDPQA
jgi:hypothetical protein